jgi:hypothetical protein
LEEKCGVAQLPPNLSRVGIIGRTGEFNPW